jgi:2,3-bisphosphoglycerate-independent phosphoglycerate mutase
MKFVILIGDGMGDYPLESLNNRTPLEATPTPNLDSLAKEGLLGKVATIPAGMPAGSDVAIMSLLGYDPSGVLTGRGPLEALALGIPLNEGELAFRLNLVTMEWNSQTIIRNHSSGDISNEETAPLLAALSERMPLSKGQRIHQGVSYRNVFIWPKAPEGLPSIPPHDYLDKPIDHFLHDKAIAPLMDLVKSSWPILKDHPINQNRRQKGLPPASSIWLWGPGRTPRVKSYAQRWGITGSTVSAVDIIRGLGLATGLTPINVPGATGGLDTNYQGKVQAALEALKTGELAVVHLEAPDEASHHGSLKDKQLAIANFDRYIVEPIVSFLKTNGSAYKILAACDHYTPLSLKTHSSDPVPFILYDSQKPAASGAAGYSEKAAAATGFFVESGVALGQLLFGQEKD